VEAREEEGRGREPYRVLDQSLGTRQIISMQLNTALSSFSVLCMKLLETY